MKTEVIMKREIFGKEISQKSKSEFFSATDLVRAGNAWRIKEGMQPFDMRAWFQQKSTKEFIAELDKTFGKVKISGRGRGNHTWVHPFLFIDMALAISPKLKIEVYSWLYDHLLKYRNNSGDSYKKMAGAIYLYIDNKSEFKSLLKETARRIKSSIKVKDWETATEDQLRQRDMIHEKIATMSEVVKVEKAIDVAIKSECGN